MCAKKDKQICVILYVDHFSTNTKAISIVEEMALLYKKDPINFFYTEKSYLSKINGIGENKLPRIYIIKGKRNRFAYVKDPFTKSNLIS